MDTVRIEHPIWFYKVSREYMRGYSNWFFFTRFPAAMIVYYWLRAGDWLHDLKMKIKGEKRLR